MFDSREIQAGRDLIVYVADYDEANDFPAATVNYSEPWAAGFAHMGLTQDGLKLGVTVDYEEIDVDQYIDPGLMVLSDREITAEVAFAQFTPQKMIDAWGMGSVTSTPAGVGTRGVDSYAILGTSSPVEKTVGFDFKQPKNAEPYRGMLWRGIPMIDSESTFGTAGDNAQTVANYRALPDDSVSPARVLELRKYSPAQ